LDWVFIAASTRAMLAAMKHALPAIGLLALLAAGPGLAGPTVEQGPLAPCGQPQDGASANSQVEPAYAWGVEIATSFSKQEALDQFAKVKQDHADLLGSYDPMVVETCDLHMGTDLQYSVRIGTDSRDAADGLCAKLQAAGGACIVQKN
jgi:sporulation related protein